MTSPGPLRSPGFHLWHSAMAWRAAVNDALDGKLTATQFFVLGAINWLGKTAQAPTQAEVSEFSMMDPMTVSQVVRTLAKSNLVTREDDPNDTRSWRLKTTAAGAELVSASAAKVREVDRRFFAHAAPQTLTDLERMNQTAKESR
ncbi:MAG: MarR family transcriptional regulator [Myxococcaceae bacterium]